MSLLGGEDELSVGDGAIVNSAENCCDLMRGHGVFYRPRLFALLLRGTIQNSASTVTGVPVMHSWPRRVEQVRPQRRAWAESVTVQRRSPQ